MAEEEEEQLNEDLNDLNDVDGEILDENDLNLNEEEKPEKKPKEKDNKSEGNKNEKDEGIGVGDDDNEIDLPKDQCFIGDHENDNDYNENDNEENEGGEGGENEPFDENDSNTDNRFPEEKETGWIKWFCEKEGNNFLVEISEEYLSKKSNLIGIKFEPYLEKILSKEDPPDPSMNEESLEQYQQLKECYGQIHRRFILSPQGLALMREKYLNEEFGHCPRILCEKQFLLPVGLSDEPKFSRVKVFCPLCEEVYTPDRQLINDLDGSYFGTAFPGFFLLAYPDLNPKLKVKKDFIPKLHGFKIVGKKGSKYYDDDKEVVKEKLKKLGVVI